MENNLQNKAKFFAQYLGQEVIIEDTSVIRKNILELFPHQLESILKGKLKYSYLELTPLSLITDEDAIKIGELDKTNHPNKKLIGHSIIHWLNKEGYHRQFTSEMADTLRSKGYALPWVGLSIEQQIEFGWVKLKIN